MNFTSKFRVVERFFICRRLFCSPARRPFQTTGTTIYALSSAPGRAGIAVIRVSGKNARVAVEKIGKMKTFPKARQATLSSLFHPESQETIDRGLVMWFPGPESFTGEDCAEFHVHGGVAVVMAMLAALGTIPGFRPADQGEFTKRAFLNNKLDLTEVEGLGDLILAETESQRKQALRQMEGDLGKLYTEWRRKLIKCLANIEAFIDFSEDENIEDGVIQQATNEIIQLMDDIKSHLNDHRQGERLRSGVRVAIIGKPNVGKSTLLNAICQRPAAIVSPIAGTTRDVIETAINIGGYAALVADTAGLRYTEDSVEQEGVTRAIARATDADVKILVLDHLCLTSDIDSAKTLQSFIGDHLLELGLSSDSVRDSEKMQKLESTSKTEDFNQSRLSRIGETSDEEITSQNKDLFQGRQPSRHDEISQKTKTSNSEDLFTPPRNNVSSKKCAGFSDLILVINKSDLLKEGDLEVLRGLQDEHDFPVCVLSCQTGYGLHCLLDVLRKHIENLCGDPLSGSPSLTQARHRTHITNCYYHLNKYLTLQNTDIVIAAEKIRQASREIGHVIGKINTEDILDVIFKDFCIGK